MFMNKEGMETAMYLINNLKKMVPLLETKTTSKQPCL